jgi:hypothetical protein
MSLIRGYFTSAAKATIWRVTGKSVYGDLTYSNMGSIKCTYTSNTQLQSDSDGREFKPSLAIFTSSSIAKKGDMVLIGTSQEAQPPSGAKEIRSIATAAPMFGPQDYDLFVS